MATTTYYIHSHYDPEDREREECETEGEYISEVEPQIVNIDPEEEWRMEVSKLPSRRVRRAPPQFVPAATKYDEWDASQASSSRLRDDPRHSALGNSLSGWYRSLTSTSSSANVQDNSVINNVSSKDKSDPTSSPSCLPSERVTAPNPKKREAISKNNWFIMNAIQLEPAPTSSSPAPSLSEILARNPPPLPSQSKFTPPVFLEIGPSNKGFGMLQRSGWNEGEALGPDVIRRKPVKNVFLGEEVVVPMQAQGKSRLTDSGTYTSNRGIVEVKMENFDVTELRNVDVIDLTLSDSESSDEDHESMKGEENEADGAVKREETSKGELHTSFLGDNSPYERKALLTPIATALKSDRLGIGLKARTEGPYKTSQKRVTHSAAAVAAHVKAAEESRLRRQKFGRGRRGFEKQHRREEQNRKAMLSYLKGL